MQTDYDAHKASYKLFPRRVKRQGPKADHLHPSSAEVRNAWSCSYTPHAYLCLGTWLTMGYLDIWSTRRFGSQVTGRTSSVLSRSRVPASVINIENMSHKALQYEKQSAENGSRGIFQNVVYIKYTSDSGQYLG